MNTPFTFGKIVVKEDFTDREDELEKLCFNFTSSVNTIIISPRRWGKSSLVTKAAVSISRKRKDLRFCFIDLNSVRSEEQFYQLYATEVLRATSSKAAAIIDNARKFLGRILPKITFTPSPGADFSFGFDWQEVKKHPDDIIDLPEKVAHQNKLRIVMCIDEFQNFSGFDDPLSFQKKMRSHWQKHQKVSYCIYGSKRHMMMDVFTSPSMPFYKFGEVIFLNKIPAGKWLSFIRKRFSDTKKKIDKEAASLIVSYADCHPYYVQQLAQQSWLRTEDACSTEVVKEAFSMLVLQMSMLFQTLTDTLGKSQVNFLKAVLKGEEKLSSQSVMMRYQLGTSANVIKIRNGLISKEIIDVADNKMVFLDPLYKYWLSEHYFIF